MPSGMSVIFGLKLGKIFTLLNIGEQPEYAPPVVVKNYEEAIQFLDGLD